MTFTEVIELFVDVGNILINKVICGIGTIISLIFLITGGEDKMMNCLVILMAIDYLTGVAKAFITEKTNSKQGFKGFQAVWDWLARIVVALGSRISE